ncbi:hypothetical protein VSS95_27880, partial [Pseudomonas syringae pv. tagetis]
MCWLFGWVLLWWWGGGWLWGVWGWGLLWVVGVGCFGGCGCCGCVCGVVVVGFVFGVCCGFVVLVCGGCVLWLLLFFLVVGFVVGLCFCGLCLWVFVGFGGGCGFVGWWGGLVGWLVVGAVLFDLLLWVELWGDHVGAFLVWGDPAVFDST